MEKYQDQKISSKEVDLIETIDKIWSDRVIIIKITGIFIVLGLIIAFTSVTQYKAEVRLLPELKDPGRGVSQLLRQFGGFSGMSLQMGDDVDAIRPDLYPDVLNSTPFYIYLMEKSIVLKAKEELITIDVHNYMNRYIPVSILTKLKRLPANIILTVSGKARGENVGKTSLTFFENIPQMSKSQYNISKSLKDRIKASINQQTNVISVSAEFPDARVSAQIAQYAVNYLTEYITQYRTEKAQKDLEFIKEQHEKKKEEFHNAQLELARFNDGNINIVTASAKIKEQQLMDQYNLALTIFNSMAQQLEQAHLKVQEETPVFKVLEPVQVPVLKSKPKRSLILVVSIIFGGLAGVGYVFVNLVLKTYMKPNSENLSAQTL